MRTPRRIFLMSLKIGQTNAIFLDAQGKQIATVEIAVGADVSDLNMQLQNQLPDTKVRADALNDNVVLSGTVNNVQEASRAQDMAERFAGSADKVVNNISIGERQQVLIQVRVSEMSRSIAKQFGVNTSAVANAGGVPIVMSTDNQFSLVGRALGDLSGTQVGEVCKTTQLLRAGHLWPRCTPGALSSWAKSAKHALGVVPGQVNVAGTDPRLLAYQSLSGNAQQRTERSPGARTRRPRAYAGRAQSHRDIG